MTTAERINKRLQQLPGSIQQDVLDFVEFLFQKSKNGKNGGNDMTGAQKAESIRLWARSHSIETPVILDDRRETLYED